MNILIICTYFRPDTAIAAKRPYMFAKNLSELGHSVTVIKSGQILETVDTSFDDSSFNFRVISYLDGVRSSKKKTSKQSLLFLPLPIGNCLFRIIHCVKVPLTVYTALKTKSEDLKKIKKVIDNLDPKNFDVVFSTYANLANVSAGKYAREKFNCKWVQDFRDRIVQPGNKSWLWNLVFSKYERVAYYEADVVTTVSDDLFNGTNYPQHKRVTIYNGYSCETNPLYDKRHGNVFTICYTGSLHANRLAAIRFLFKELSALVNEGLIDLHAFKFVFVGGNGVELKKIAHLYGLHSIVDDYGYLQLGPTHDLQMKSDLFLVLSENSDKYQGIVTGKFYEGIQCRKPILSVVYGDTPNSELYRLNEKYHYGFCYETCRSDMMRDAFKEFILSFYHSRLFNGEIDFPVNKELVDKFNYNNLTKELEIIFNNLMNRQ